MRISLIHPYLLDRATGEPLRALGLARRTGAPIWPIQGGDGNAPTIVDQYNTLITEAKNAFADPALSADGLTEAKNKLESAKALGAQIAAAKDADALMASMGVLAPGKEQEGNDPGSKGDQPAGTVGEFFIKNAHTKLVAGKGVEGLTVNAGEFSPRAKAATDPQLVGGSLPTGLAIPGYDTSVTRAYRRPLIDDLLGSGTMSGNSLTYFVEGAKEGAFTSVAEGAAKPQLHYLYTTVTDVLSKIAGFIKISDEMIEDVPFLVSEINERLLWDLALERENQLLNGNGTAPNLRGILNRSGIQTVTSAAAINNLDKIFEAITAVNTATGLTADALVLHPTNYQTFRLLKDANGQYLGGGPFTGPYGVGLAAGVLENPSIWGLRTVVSSAVALNTALVGAFRQAATRYTKGGVRVQSTNSHASDFTNNMVTIRAEERVGLAVRVPAAFAKVVLSTV